MTKDLLSKGLKKIVYNLTDVGHIDSSGVSCLVATYTSVRNLGGDLKLLSPTKKVRDHLGFTNLDAIFDILTDEPSAIRAFGESAAAGK